MAASVWRQQGCAERSVDVDGIIGDEDLQQDQVDQRLPAKHLSADSWANCQLVNEPSARRPSRPEATFGRVDSFAAHPNRGCRSWCLKPPVSSRDGVG